MSRRRVQPVEVRADTSRPHRGDEIHSHPAFGQIGASRSQGTGTVLYGSEFLHRDVITITISSSEMRRGLSMDWPHATRQLIEVEMSEAQWAEFVSKLNHGSGTRCTIRHVGGEWTPGIPEPVRRHEQFEGEMAQCLIEAEKQAKRLEELIANNGKKSEMRDAIIQLRNPLSPNISFIAKQFGEHMEDMTSSAKIEIEAHMSNAIQRAGLKALAEGAAPIALPEEKKK